MKKILLLVSFLALLFTACNTLNRESVKEEWISLFNGRNLNNWMVKIHHHEFGENFGNTFRVNDGAIQVNYEKYGDFNEQFGHLYYKTPYSFYHLKLEYRFIGELHQGAPSFTVRNSGVMFHSQDPRTMPKEQDWPISVEMQFLGGLGDGKPRTTGNMCSPGTKIVYNGKLDERHCISSSSKTYEGDQWVSAELIVLGDSLITHIINGDTVMKYSKPQVGGDVVKRFDPKMKPDGKLLSSGYIALQSEGQPVEFRNILLKDLSMKDNK